MTSTQSKSCPNCEKWLADYQEVCPHCGAPRNLFDEEQSEIEADSSGGTSKKIYYKAGRTSFLIGLWLMLFPGIMGTIYMFTSFNDIPLVLKIAGLMLPSFYFILLYSATHRFIKYRMQLKKRKREI